MSHSEQDDQPKPTTGEWTVGTTVSGGDKYPAIMCKGKVVWFTCLSSDRNELRKLCRAHNAALAAAFRAGASKLKFEAEDELDQIGDLQKQLAAERKKVQTLIDALTQIKTLTLPTNECYRICEYALAKVGTYPLPDGRTKEDS